ncbi:hypothetical protein O181_014144 [Austropuccinia psidii MF-1]|uniref:Uncharacterized protein n=1 Tax=Austropuccinia psidii MF-1 TaxID=1389203 RepID=A0A9Q3GPK4_9BASI|nr:hypothetical protein [Austropuccinia psidii MF-1]
MQPCNHDTGRTRRHGRFPGIECTVQYTMTSRGTMAGVTGIRIQDGRMRSAGAQLPQFYQRRPDRRKPHAGQTASLIQADLISASHSLLWKFGVLNFGLHSAC